MNSPLLDLKLQALDFRLTMTHRTEHSGSKSYKMRQDAEDINGISELIKDIITIESTKEN